MRVAKYCDVSGLCLFVVSVCVCVWIVGMVHLSLSLETRKGIERMYEYGSVVNMTDCIL